MLKENLLKEEKGLADPGQPQKTGAAKPTYVSTDPKRKMKKEQLQLEAKDKKGKGSGTKDACYHKVKSRYSVWPSAYASGALVKCRKVGAANWGNKSESFSNWREELGEAKKCWPGYKKVGTQKLFGKTYNRCVKKEDIELTDAYGETFAVVSDVVKPEKLEATVCPRCGHNPCICDDTYDIDSMIESVRMPSQNGNLVDVYLNWRGKYYAIKMFFPNSKMPRRSDVQDQIVKVYPDARVQSFQVSKYVPGQPFLHVSEERQKNGGATQEITVSDSATPGGVSEVSEGSQIEEASKYDKEGNDKFDRYKRMVRHKQDKYGVSTLKQRLKHGGVDHNIDNEKKAKMKNEEVEKVDEYYGMAGGMGGSLSKRLRDERLKSLPKTDAEAAAKKKREKTEVDEDWQKVNRKDKTDGLSQKAVDAYRRENPGSKLKTAVTTKPSKLKKGSKDANRRKSFCSRMKGMKKRLTSAKTANDPDSRINKASLRRWNC